MDGEQNGTQTQQGTKRQEQQTSQQQASQQETQGKHTKEAGADAGAGSDVDAKAYKKQLADRDSRIKELEAQIAEAATAAEAADGLQLPWMRGLVDEDGSVTRSRACLGAA